jgi:aerobic-type carbon monoxide dehydrogenase small subunit (CoxS/CutS family)
MTEPIQFTLNGRAVRFDGDGDRTLLWVLRTDFGLTGPKYGCGEGACGACTVLVGGEAVLSCQTTVKAIAGGDIVTIEGLAENGVLHPVQEAFIETGGLQCGFCTPGMVLRAASLLNANPSPTRQEIIDGMEGNLCRCGAHMRIVEAIEIAAGKGGSP